MTWRYSAYGKLKSVRLPKKFDARTRGFAFLEFVTRHEAENAFDALSGAFGALSLGKK